MIPSIKHSKIDLKRAVRFLFYKSEDKKQRTRKRKRSIFSDIRRKEDELNDMRIMNKMWGKH